MNVNQAEALRRIDASLDCWLARQYGISVDEMPQKFTPSFKEGAEAAWGTYLYHSEDLQINKRGEATVRPLSSTYKGRVGLRDFLHKEIAYRYKPESEWTSDFLRGVDAEIKWIGDPVMHKVGREFQAFARQQLARQKHPILARLGVVWAIGKLNQLIT
jgi:hypothetical protein